MSKREISVCQQTWALICKNFLKKWRMKREPLMEWISSLFLLLFLYLYPHGHDVHDFSSLPTLDLGRVDSFSESRFSIAYTPITNTTQQVMDKVASASFLVGKFSSNLGGITVSFLHKGHCYEMNEDVNCEVSLFWEKGFVALQAAINAAIIEVTTNHSVMEELMSVTGRCMKIHPFIAQAGVITDMLIFFCIISFSPFTYYASVNVTRERKRMKGLMVMMGLRESAFWISWGLLYASFIFLMALFLALVIKSTQFIILTGFMVVFALFLLYGLSLLHNVILFVVLIAFIPSSLPPSSPSFPLFFLDLVLDIYEGQITAILGHSGAGKSTLLNILNGLSVPTKGSVAIYNNKLSEMGNLENISMLTGVCPQANVQFDFLTVKENLRLFAKIKGILPQEVDKEIFLLDEPTAGLDPFSRHRVWNLLKERKADRVVLFSTQFMDEADILAGNCWFPLSNLMRILRDLRSIDGFLNSRIFLQLNEICVQENITSLVKQHIPDAQLSTASEGKVVYTLPLERTNKFPGNGSPFSPFSPFNKWSKTSGLSTILNSPMMWLFLFFLISDYYGYITVVYLYRVHVMLLMLVVGLSPLLVGNIMVKIYQNSYTWRLSPHSYFLAPGQQPRDSLTQLLIINKTGASIDDFIHSLELQNIALKVDVFGIKNGTDDPVYNGAITVSGNKKNYNFSFACNTKRLNCFPVLMDIVSNGLLGMVKPSAHIQTDRSTTGVTVVSVAGFMADTLERGLQFYITFLVPPATLIGCFFLYLYSFAVALFTGESMGVTPFLIFLIPFLHFIIFLFILRCLEWKFGKKSMRKDPFFRISPRSSDVCQNPEEPQGEDEDVQMERVRTANALSSTDFDEKPVIIASCLRKEYAGKRKCCLSKRKNKIATRNVSFCVRQGEVLGLLGHNGAGKSTSIKVITGDTKPTAGQVLLKGSGGGDTLGFLGYCPQENALWPSLTVREHLEVYAAVKGLRKVDTEVTITRLVNMLKLQDQLKAPTKTLSEGMKRKLCFALSILGNPSVVLLDEPSTGMDPEGQQQMWQAIRATFRNTERGALLTTHYMAEAEAVCDRVAIMVSGRLRCIGSIQQLKSKFGKDYLLEMKVKTPTQVEPLHAEILRLFPQAARQERYSSLMVYKLPVEDVRPLAQAFFKLEKVKQSFDLEEYSLSQSTLEQVFLELSKEQELDDFGEEIDPSVKWKLLPQEKP
uniref:ATP binding cassette subfamily A member 8 n=1 Tax=Propithecus coquereli TaxID=379532 RepID=A0A2K6ERM0_PROCO